MKADEPDCIEFTDKSGAKLYSNLQSRCVTCIAECKVESESFTCRRANKARRRGKLVGPDGSTFLCTLSSDLVTSSKLFKKELGHLTKISSRFSIAKEDLARQEATKTNRLFHNLVSLNAHALQDLYSMVEQDELAHSGSYQAQKNLIKNSLLGNADAAAMLFLRALKNETAVKTELSVFRKLNDPSPVLRPQAHPLHKVILNVVNLFFQDLADSGIRVNIERTDAVLFVDYEALQVALYHLMDNACKYVMPKSEIRISVTTSATRVCIIFDMYSFYVKQEEREQVFDEEFSGKLAKETGKAGKGLGMGLIRDLLKLNKGSIAITWGEPDLASPTRVHGEPIFTRNSFVLSFPIAQLVVK